MYKLMGWLVPQAEAGQGLLRDDHRRDDDRRRHELHAHQSDPSPLLGGSSKWRRRRAGDGDHDADDPSARHYGPLCHSAGAPGLRLDRHRRHGGNGHCVGSDLVSLSWAGKNRRAPLSALALD